MTLFSLVRDKRVSSCIERAEAQRALCQPKSFQQAFLILPGLSGAHFLHFLSSLACGVVDGGILFSPRTIYFVCTRALVFNVCVLCESHGEQAKREEWKSLRAAPLSFLFQKQSLVSLLGRKNYKKEHIYIKSFRRPFTSFSSI
jgi:hypothetical protein